jgi:hypothetical protein
LSSRWYSFGVLNVSSWRQSKVITCLDCVRSSAEERVVRFCGCAHAIANVDVHMVNANADGRNNSTLILNQKKKEKKKKKKKKRLSV